MNDRRRWGQIPERLFAFAKVQFTLRIHKLDAPGIAFSNAKRNESIGASIILVRAHLAVLDCTYIYGGKNEIFPIMQMQVERGIVDDPLCPWNESTVC